MLNELCAACADGEPQRQLATTAGRGREQQVGHRRTGHDQHQRDEAEQQPQRGLELTSNRRVAGRAGFEAAREFQIAVAPAGPPLGRSRRDERSGPHGLERGVGLRDRHAGVNAAHDAEPEAVRAVESVPFIAAQAREHRHRDGQLRRHPDRDPEEACRSNANDGERLPFDTKRTADRGVIAAKPPLPGVMAQHRYRLCFGRRVSDVSLSDQAARRRLKAESVVERASHEHHRRRFGLARPLGLKRPRFPCEHACEHMGAIAHLLEHRVGKGWIPKPDQVTRCRNRQRAQHDRVDQREDGGHSTYPQGQRQNAAKVSPGARRNCRSANRRSRATWSNRRYIEPSSR